MPFSLTMGNSKGKTAKNDQPETRIPPARYRIVVLGAGTVGKSATIFQFIQSVFYDKYRSTIEDSYSKQCVIDDIPAHLDILDTAGQDEFASLKEEHMRRGEGFLVIYSVTDRHSFEEVDYIRNSLARVKDRIDFPLIIAGNKIDLTNERVISFHEGEALVERYGNRFCQHIETSARTRQNIDDAFINLVKLIRQYRDACQNPTSLSTTQPSKKFPCHLL